jgi:ferritin-like metal-binding protein YciE
MAMDTAQRVEHYEMAAYGCLRTFAKLLGDMPSAKLLQETLDEEADSDRKLTEIAEFSINLRLCEPVTA